MYILKGNIFNYAEITFNKTEKQLRINIIVIFFFLPSRCHNCKCQMVTH